jgi:alkylated DNA repair protein (DNA oxidative demethylase)
LDLLSSHQADKLLILADAYLLKGFALPQQTQLLADLQDVITLSPFRRMVTPGGFTMSVAMTNCGDLGWTTARTGYRYTTYDPLNDAPWPAMPVAFTALAKSAAHEAGYPDFKPDACLINHYHIGARMALHQDKNELDFSQPIVSVSLGLTAVFQFGGFQRADKAIKLMLEHGDVVVWGGHSRMRYHGILPIKAGNHSPNTTPTLGDCRINLTLRKAG